MFESTLISIAHDVCRDLRRQKPATLFAAYDEGDQNADNLNRAATKTGRFLLSYHTWEHLIASHTWVATADAVQAPTLCIPTDFHRLMPRTVYDHGRKMFLRETGADEWSRENARHRSYDRHVSFTRNGVRLSGVSAGTTIGYDYIRKAVCKTSYRPAVPEVLATVPTVANPCPPPASPAMPEVLGGVLNPDFTRDDDIPLWDSELFTLGMIWNMQHRDGNTTNEDYQAFVGRLHEVINHDAPSGVLNMGGPVLSDEDDNWWGI